MHTLAPKPKTTIHGQGHTIYPYLLKGLVIDKPNQVWAADITYIPMRKGFLYLIAIIDLHSRFVINWSLSNTMDAEVVCRDAEGSNPSPRLSTDF